MSALVAIVGRPNVGKSTLFNRLIGARKAITDPTPGVTRDPVTGELRLPGGVAQLWDTGGVADSDDATDRLVADRAREVMGHADLILLVVDATNVVGDDLRLVESLRPLATKVILVVNKVDNERRELHVPELHRLGFATVVAIAAVHGRNLQQLREEMAARLFAGAPPDPTPTVGHGHPDSTVEVPRLAIVGKPNAGKSTLLNALAGGERALVADVPGTTRDPVEAMVAPFGYQLYVVDTAGMRRKNRVAGGVEYYSVNRAVDAVSRADIALLTVDADDGLSDQDKKIAAVAVRRGSAVVVGLSKWDLVTERHSGTQRGDLLRAMTDRIRFQFPVLSFAPVMPFSAQTGTGLRNLVEKVISVRRQLATWVPTGQLNAALGDWSAQTSFSVRGREIRSRYITQTSSNPVRFVLFVNRPQDAPDAYRRFIENRIRQELGFSEVPVGVDIRGS